MSHYILKLVTGEFVYGELDLENSDKKMITLTNPLIWEDFESDDGYMGQALVKYMIGTSETSIPFASASIISMAAMSDAFVDFYSAAIACNKITDEAYHQKLLYMTERMAELVIDHQNKAKADETGGLVITDKQSNTIH